MNNIEKIKAVFELYYERDEQSRKMKDDYLKRKNEYDSLCDETYDAVLEIEKKIGIKLSDYYKDSLIAKAGIYISNENLSNEFRFYDKRELYNFNYLGKEIGFSAKEELKDFFVIGQDEGESSYFLDVHDNLGLGIDTIWKVNRCDCEDFVVVGKNFIDFLEAMATNRKSNSDIIPEDEPTDFINVDDYIKRIQSEITEENLHKLNKDIQLIYNYISEIKKQDDLMIFSSYSNKSAESLIRIQNSLNDFYPVEFIYELLNLRSFAFSLKNLRVEAIILEQFEKFNIGKKSKKHLHDVLVFALNKSSLFIDINGSDWDYFFIDYQNKLGKGAEAIYIISENSKKLEEACYVAKDIVNLFRIFAEDEEINTTPIGKIK